MKKEFGVYFKDIKLGVICIEKEQLTFHYVEDFQKLNLMPIPNFPLIKEYGTNSVLSFLMNRVSPKKITKNMTIEKVISLARKVAHSPLEII